MASDAGKTAEFRALLRIRRAMSDHWQDAAFKNFSRLLLKARPGSGTNLTGTRL